jgi:Reverse transcriptase (RNA-dependent DNA polymerase)
VLINLYTNGCVRNGIKRGAVLSPALFCVYINDLLLSVKKAGFGCYTGAKFVGALAYAGDIVLVVPSATALRKMLAMFEDCVDEYCMF